MTIERAALATASSSSPSLPNNASTHHHPLTGAPGDGGCCADFSDSWPSSLGSKSSLSPTVNPHEDEVSILERRRALTTCNDTQKKSAAHNSRSWMQEGRNSVGIQGPELRSKSSGTGAWASTGRGIIFLGGTFAPLEPRPGKKPGGRGCWTTLVLRVDKADGCRGGERKGNGGGGSTG